jgi:hypothetical protein
MKTYGGMDIQINVFLTLALVGGEWLTSRPGCFTPVEGATGTHWIGGWVGPRTGMDDVEGRKILPLGGLKLLGSPTHNHSLFRLQYPGSVLYIS